MAFLPNLISLAPIEPEGMVCHHTSAGVAGILEENMSQLALKSDLVSWQSSSDLVSDYLIRHRNPNVTLRPLNPRSVALEELIARIAGEYGVNIADLALPTKARHLSRARAHIAREAVQRRLATLAQVSRRLKRSPSSLCELIQRHPE